MVVCAGKLVSGSIDIRVWNLESLTLERVLQVQTQETGSERRKEREKVRDGGREEEG